MGIASLVVVGTVGWAGPAQDSITPEVVGAVKRASVFLKVEAGGMSFFGSGFVAKVKDRSAWIVTNHHVLEPKVEVEIRPRAEGGDRDPFGPMIPINPFRPTIPDDFVRPRFPNPLNRTPQPVDPPRKMIRTLWATNVTAVFDSGQTTECSAKAVVLTKNSELDLAVLRVDDVEGLANPIDVNKDPVLVETTPVYTFGFPFGAQLSPDGRNPAITVGRGHISSVRKNDKGETVVVQVDANVNPGGSGGPIVNAKGELVGVAVARIREATGIGLAVPIFQLKKALQSRFGDLRLEINGRSPNRTCRYAVGFEDFYETIKDLDVYFTQGSGAKLESLDTACLDPTPGCRREPLLADKGWARAKFDLDLSEDKGGILFQAVYKTSDGRIGRSKVIVLGDAPVAAAKPKSTKPATSKMDANLADLKARLRREMNSFPVQTPPWNDDETRTIGGGFGGASGGREVAPGDGLLVGFELGLAPTFIDDLPCAVRPIFRTKDGEVLGRQFGTKWKKKRIEKAKEGYAVAGVTCMAGAVLDGFSVTYARVAGGKLDMKDVYESEWIGGGVSPKTKLGCDGSLIIGVNLKANENDVTGMALVRRNPK